MADEISAVGSQRQIREDRRAFADAGERQRSRAIGIRKQNIGGTAFDNVVAYQEGQGAAKLDRTPDLFAFMGATQVELAFIVAPEIKSYQDLKGKTLALDALSTGFAFVLYEMLTKSGL